jgi:hypothetical protein
MPAAISREKKQELRRAWTMGLSCGAAARRIGVSRATACRYFCSFAHRQGAPRKRRAAAIPRYDGPPWIGTAITMPPAPVGPAWIGQSIHSGDQHDPQTQTAAPNL